MRTTRRVLGAVAGLALFTFFVAPAAAQPSVNGELISNLNLDLLYVAVPITVLVEGILIYTVYQFRNNDEAKPTQENRRLEITWTVATAIILLFVGLASYQVLGSEFIGGATANNPGDEAVEGLSHNYSGAYAPSEEDAVEVEVVARKYSWTFNYVGSDGNVSSTDELVIPANRPVYLHVTSIDWLHALHAPELYLKQDAIPGQYNTIKTNVTEPGVYQLYCAEYCGVGHSGMLGTIRVVSPQEYQQWLSEQGQSSSGSGSSNNSSSAGNASNSSSEVLASPA